MKTMKIVGIIIIAMTLFFACGKKMTEAELYAMAQEQYGSEKYEEALKSFQKLVDEFPKGQKHAEAMFMLGFINANDLKNLELAEKHYKTFLEKYPGHDLSDDAEYEIKTLGKDINDLPIFQQMISDSLQK